MTRIKLTDKQALDLWNGKDIRIKRNYMIYYINNTRTGYYVTDWTGHEYDVYLSDDLDITNCEVLANN